MSSGKYIGAHVSASGGVEYAPINANEIGANAFALFLSLHSLLFKGNIRFV